MGDRHGGLLRSNSRRASAKTRRRFAYTAAAAAIIVVTAVVLLGMGRVPICTCGYVKPWHGIVTSSENSQHVSDWYTFSHVIHGFLFYLGYRLIGGRSRWPAGLVLAVLLESAWEIFENTPFIINRYRAQTIALDYYGDSVINSLADIGAMALGFVLASRWPAWTIVALALVMELFVGYWIRDNLTLNIIQLVYPTETVLRWQQGA
jgi:hypothetical protein